MSRISGATCQSQQPTFTEETRPDATAPRAPTPQREPAKGGAGPRPASRDGSRSASTNAERLQRLGDAGIKKSHGCSVRALVAEGAGQLDELAGHGAEGLAGLASKLQDSRAAELLGKASTILDKAALVMLPVVTLWKLAEGLCEIGNAHLEAQLDGEAESYREGVTQAVAAALGNPGASVAQLRAAAGSARYVDHLDTLSRSRAASPSQREGWAKQVARYALGAEAGVRYAAGLGAKERQALAAYLLQESRTDDPARAVRDWISVRAKH